MNKNNLTKLKIQTDQRYEKNRDLKDFSNKLVKPNFDSVEVILRNHETRLIDIIQQFEKGVIIGCVAWLTSEPILNAL